MITPCRIYQYHITLTYLRHVCTVKQHLSQAVRYLVQVTKWIIVRPSSALWEVWEFCFARLCIGWGWEGQREWARLSLALKMEEVTLYMWFRAALMYLLRNAQIFASKTVLHYFNGNKFTWNWRCQNTWVLYLSRTVWFPRPYPVLHFYHLLPSQLSLFLYLSSFQYNSMEH